MLAYISSLSSFVFSCLFIGFLLYAKYTFSETLLNVSLGYNVMLVTAVFSISFENPHFKVALQL